MIPADHKMMKTLFGRLRELDLYPCDLDPAQLRRIFLDEWVMVVDDRFGTNRAIWVCPIEELQNTFHS